jgi:NAD(P)-dependent dehydrogenase (short-subunit alcohol dehydrogenase family)
MTDRVALITGGSSGLGRAMGLGLARAGGRVLAAGHLAADCDALAAEIAGTPLHNRVHALVADLRHPAECDRVVRTALDRFGRIDILVNCAGLTFTYICPDRFRRREPQKFWEVSDEITRTVIDTNIVAHDQMTRRVMPHLVGQGWGRIVNVTTKLDTMNREGSALYGATKAALEMATEVWAKEAAGTGVTINIVNPGQGADTPGMAEEMRARHRSGEIRLTEPEEMVPPFLFVVSEEGGRFNGWRFDAHLWNPARPLAENIRASGRLAGFELHPPAT